MATQAENIRLITIELLKKSKIQIPGSDDIFGIRYSDLKKRLLNSTHYDFTEGAVTGTLYTLPDRMENVYKTKTKKGTYFYYSESEKNEPSTKLNSITDSEQYEELIDSISNAESLVGDILRKASKGNYKETTDLDIENLRKILTATNNLNNLLKSYEFEKSFELIQNSRYSDSDDLPF